MTTLRKFFIILTAFTFFAACESTAKIQVSKTKTETSSKSAPSQNSKNQNKTVWSGNQTLDWGSNISIPAEKFSSFAQGQKLTLQTELPSASYHNIKIYDGSWQNLSAGQASGAAFSNGLLVPSASGKISYTPSAAEAQNIKSKGLIIHGYGVILKSLSFDSGNSTDDSNSSANDGAKSSPAKSSSKSDSSKNPEPVSKSGTPYANHGKLHVSGANLCDSKNKNYMLYGMSTHGINFGNEFSRYVTKESLKSLRDDWNINAVRLVLYPRDYNGYCSGGNKSELKQIVKNGIQAATELGLYVIVDWHVHQYNPRETESDAIAFLGEISAEYANYGNVLYEICNEPTGSEWNSVLKPYAEKVIPAIRKNAPDSVIIVGTNTWSQDIEGPLANPLSFKNVMYTFHFYANTHRDSYRTRVEKAVKGGLPVFITEFGTCDASGNGGFNAEESRKWFDLLKKYNISHLNWSLSNKGETASAIQSWSQKTSGWSENELTESGKLVRNHFRTLSR